MGVFGAVLVGEDGPVDFLEGDEGARD